jgi:hypothetical protein
MDRQTRDKFSCEKTECWAGIPAKGLARTYTIDVVSCVIQIAVQSLDLIFGREKLPENLKPEIMI